MVFLDDIIIFSRTPEEHEDHVRTVLTLLQDKGFTIKASKCTFSATELDLLGFRISSEGVHPQENKVAVIWDMAPPNNVKAVRRFLGMVGFYRSMIPAFAKYASKLTDLTRKHAQWKWTADHQTAFDHLRTALISDGTVLHYRDLNKPYELYTDSSESAIGALLLQRDESGVGRPIQFISHTLNETQRRWPMMEREAYAIVHALKVLRPYLHGAKFRIFTDHKPLKAMFMGEVKNTKVERWAMLISEYGAPIEYIKGSNNVRADFLSCLPPPELSSVCDIDWAPTGVNYYDGHLSADGIDPGLFKAAQAKAFLDLVGGNDEFVMYEGYVCTTRRPAGGLEYPRVWVPEDFQRDVTIIITYWDTPAHR